MPDHLILDYSAEADVLTIRKCDAYVGQKTAEIADLVIARRHPLSGDIEQLEILAFRERLGQMHHLKLPVTGDLQVVASQFVEPMAAE